jgi:diaminopropionate ammonia-lyase
VDACVAVGDELLREGVRSCYHNEGGRVLAGDSGAAGLAGLAAIAGGEVADKLDLNRDSVVLVINSESLTDMAKFRLAVM